MAFPYKDNKAVPWRYDCNIISAKTFDHQEPSTNITEVDHFTCSGRCYRPDEKKDEERKQGQPRRSKVVEKGEPSIAEPKKVVSEKEACEFLKLIKHSEYSIMEQLHQQPAKISILALLLNSEPHRAALLKVLNQAYVANDISTEKLDRLVGNIAADNFISFSDDEIPTDGRGSTKALQSLSTAKGTFCRRFWLITGLHSMSCLCRPLQDCQLTFLL